MAKPPADPRDRYIAMLERQLDEQHQTIRALARALRPASAPVSRETPPLPAAGALPELPDPRKRYSDELMDALLEVAPDPESETHRAHITWIEREKRKGKSDLELAADISAGLDPDLFL